MICCVSDLVSCSSALKRYATYYGSSCSTIGLFRSNRWKTLNEIAYRDASRSCAPPVCVFCLAPAVGPAFSAVSALEVVIWPFFKKERFGFLSIWISLFTAKCAPTSSEFVPLIPLVCRALSLSLDPVALSPAHALFRGLVGLVPL